VTCFYQLKNWTEIYPLETRILIVVIVTTRGKLSLKLSHILWSPAANLWRWIKWELYRKARFTS